MSARVIVTPEFMRSAKKLLKKYNSLRGELVELNKSLEANPFQGDKITEGIYKIRLAIRSKGRGKSGGGRVITYVDVEVKDEEEMISVYLLKIYDKSDFSNISTSHLEQIVGRIRSEQEEE
ncbi:MAG: hypothetical protein AAFY76_00900 [Cyanobacteria bacterium J06649_11]